MPFTIYSSIVARAQGIHLWWLQHSSLSLSRVGSFANTDKLRPQPGALVVNYEPYNLHAAYITVLFMLRASI